MRRFPWGLLLLVALVDCVSGSGSGAPVPRSSSQIFAVVKERALPVQSGSFASAYPATRTGDARDMIFGTVVNDPYRWLEDVADPAVTTWLKQQDDLTRAKLAALPNRDAIAKRLKELSYVERVGAPTKRANRYFTWKRGATQEKYALYWKDGKDGAERALLDPNVWPTEAGISLVDACPSLDGKTVEFRVSKNNADEATTRVMDVASGRESVIDTIDGTQFGEISWAAKGDGFYYRFTPSDAKLPPGERYGITELRFHKLGEDPKRDRVVHQKTGDANVFLTGFATRDGHWLFAELFRGWTSNEVQYQDLRNHPGIWVSLATTKDAQYFVHPYHDRFYVLTDEGAHRKRAFVVDPAHAARDEWREIVPERAGATLTGIAILGGKLVLTYLQDAATNIEVHDLNGALMRDVSLPAIGTASASGAPDDDTAYVEFTSFTHPTEILETSINAGSSRLSFRVKVPVDVDRFVVEQVSYTSKDGTRVPMFIVHAKDLKKDGRAPLFLTGYGGFQVSMTPQFDASIFPWLERGGVYAVPNLRGGGELGETWHRNGMRRNKQNVFDDFYAAAEYLIREGYTAADKMVAYGDSNGGLLVGAAITQRPDLFRVALCDVPILDMIRFDKSALGKPFVEEYGSPDDTHDFSALFAYSPYHHVVAGTKYPSVLVLSADSDDRVDPMHARKFTAELQARSAGGPVLLRVERHAGHAGADLISAWVDQFTSMYSFALAEIHEVGSSMR